MIGGAVVLIAAAGAALASPTMRRLARRLMMQLAERRQETFAHPGTLDELTGLANRPEAMRLLTEALEQAQAQGSRVGVLHVDIDDFTDCVETYGAAAGDHVLQVSAARLQAQLRSGDVVCRIGADDLLVIMQAAPPNHVVTRIGQRIAEALAQPITYDGETILITATMGISVAKDGVAEPDELVSQATGALNEARASGTHVLQY
jgi:diguanylate cyclase (GGDEF)-like protein